MKKIQTDSDLTFIEDYCRIHGKFGDKVYRRKRNGQMWVYDYTYKPKYEPTVFSRRADCVVKTAASFTNPQYKGYKEIINKLYYYTPYFVYAGSYNITCNTFLKLRRKGEYTLQIGDMKIKLDLAPRTQLELSFEEQKTYSVKCYKGNMVYCEREVIVIPPEQGLEAAYNDWYAEHLGEILLKPKPGFMALRIYRHGVEPPAWLGWLNGKTDEGILYRSRRDRFMYIRSDFVHQHNPSGDYFYEVQPRVTACWSAAATGFRQVWDKYYLRWFDANYLKTWKITKMQNFWSKLVFRAAGALGFDLKTLSVTNWLPGVVTIGDLLLTAEMGSYGLKQEELNTKIY
jgi:hypothetical protein